MAGQRILLYAEQGFGDTVQFCRYARLIAERGAYVMVEVQPALKSVLSGLAGVDHLLAQGETLPAFDYQCPLLSLPLACSTTLATIPEDVQKAQLDVDQARANLDVANLTSEERKRLLKEGAIAGRDVDTAIAALDEIFTEHAGSVSASHSESHAAGGSAHV